MRNPLLRGRILLIALVASVGVHLLIALWSSWQLSNLPSLDLELQLPSEVEFGLVEQSEFEAPAQPETVPTPAKKKPELLKEADAEKVAPDETETPPKEEQQEQLPVVKGKTLLPPGAQIAIRMDLQRIERSPVSAQVKRLLSAIPDWRILLAGSSIDPLVDLKRVLVASPNFQRANLVIAGEHTHEPDFVKRQVEQLAARKGKPAVWTTQFGIETAPWWTDESTERVVALLGPNGFLIATPKDLPRALAVAQYRNKQQSAPDQKPSTLESGLLSMPENVALSLEVEGTEHFIRGMTQGVPKTLKAWVREGDQQAQIEIGGKFQNKKGALEAETFWKNKINAYGRTLDQYDFFGAGFSKPIKSATYETKANSLTIQTEVPLPLMRLGLQMLTEQMIVWTKERDAKNNKHSNAAPSTP